MSPLEELEAAELSHGQTSYLVGYLASVLDDHKRITRAAWSAAIQYAEEWTA